MQREVAKPPCSWKERDALLEMSEIKHLKKGRKTKWGQSINSSSKKVAS